MSAKVWKFLSNTIGKLQSPRHAQVLENVGESSSLHQAESLSDTPTRHGSSNKNGIQHAEVLMSSVKSEILNGLALNEKSNNINEKLKKAYKQTSESEPEGDVKQYVTAMDVDRLGTREAPESVKISPSDASSSTAPPRQGRSKGKEFVKKAEPLAHMEQAVEAHSRKTRGRGRLAKAKREESPEQTHTYDERPSELAQSKSNGLEEEEIAELVDPVIESPGQVNNSSDAPKTRGRSRSTKAAKKVAVDETPVTRNRVSNGVEGEKGESIAAVTKLSTPVEAPIQTPAIRSSARRILPKADAPVQTSVPPIASTVSHKRNRDVLESSSGNERLGVESPGSGSDKRRKLAPRAEEPGVPPVGTTQEERDERRKYMDRERQRRCRQRKKERQQGERAAERAVVAQAKDERKKAMARERVRRHRESQRSKRAPETETKMGNKQRFREEARQRDRDLIISGGRNLVAAPAVPAVN